MTPRPAKDAADALQHIRAGGKAYLMTCTRGIVIDLKCLKEFEALGYVLLKDDADGRGMRIRRGRRFDYVFAGQIQLA